MVEQHRGTVEGVVLRRQDVGGAGTVPVEGGVEDGLHQVAVGEAVGPLPLPLEPSGDGTPTESLLTPALLSQARVPGHQVAGDERHLDRVAPPLVMQLRFLVVRRVEVLALPEVLTHPGERLLMLLDVVDLLIDAARELAHVDVLVAHTEVLGPELVLDHGARDAHRHRPHGQVGASLHLGDSQSTDGVVE